MTDAEKADVSWAAALAASRMPRREVLRLGDGCQTSVFVHAPAGSPRRMPVLYVHGIQSHPGWFVGSAAAMAGAGHQVFQVTRRGSGDGAQARGDAKSAGQLLEDVQEACQFALTGAGGDRLHLVGVSWGGKLLAAYAAHPRRTVQVASLTLVAPGIVPAVDVPLEAKLAIVLSLLVAPHRRFDIPLSDVELFTDNEAMREYLRRDPLRLRRATARFLYASRRLDAMRRACPSGSLSMPTTLMLARRDRIINNRATLQEVQRLAGGKASVIEFDAAHTLDFEPHVEPFHQALCSALMRGESS